MKRTTTSGHVPSGRSQRLRQNVNEGWANFGEIWISQNLPRDQEIRIWSMQYKGIVKYLEPDSKWLINNAVDSIWGLIQLEATSYKEVFSWVRVTNKNWENVLRRKLFEKRIKSFFHWSFNRINFALRGLR